LLLTFLAQRQRAARLQGICCLKTGESDP
jgi:hypothetical protein